MKKAVSSLLGVLLLSVLGLAQSTPEPGPAAAPPQTASATAKDSAAPPAQNNQLAPGTVISAELSKSLDAKKIKANDKVEARTSMDLLARGQILVPRNAKIIGHVTEAKARTKESPDSVVGIAFDRILLKDGREFPLQAAVQALGRPLLLGPSLSTADSAMDSPTGITQAGVGPRGTMAGIPATAPAQYPSQYPDRNTGPSSPDANPPSSTVSPLGPTSHGVVGMKGLSLHLSGAATVVSSTTDNVHLESGTQLILRVE
jgi:hypothetical protein